MFYLVQIPEDQTAFLHALVRRINPDADYPRAIAVSEEGQMTRLDLAAKHYAQFAADHRLDFPAWATLPETIRTRYATDLASYIGWQFDGFTFEYQLPDDFPQLLAEHTGRPAHEFTPP